MGWLHQQAACPLVHVTALIPAHKALQHPNTGKQNHNLSQPLNPQRPPWQALTMSMAFSNTPQWPHSNSISPYTARHPGSSSSGMAGMGGRSSAGMDLEP
jgi:hypothetical protein